MAGPLEAGETALFVDRRGRSKLVDLVSDQLHHTHTGTIDLNEVIGHAEGVEVTTAGGAKYKVVRPTLAEYVLRMKRGAQVIYPKDIGPILMLADIFPGARVLEAGVGSGALTTALVRAGADVTGYDMREDFAEIAKRNVSGFLGEGALERFRVQIRDIYDGIDETGLDRIVLDLPEPWRVVPHAAKALAPGGILVAYVPSITQVSHLRDAIVASPFGIPRTIEVMERSWHVEGRAVRPDHRMVGHTGFLTQTRLLPGVEADESEEAED